MDHKAAKNVMRKLAGRIAIPSSLEAEANDLAESGFIKIHKRQSGHWQTTEKGRCLLSCECPDCNEM